MATVSLPIASLGAEDPAAGPARALATAVTTGGQPTSTSLATCAQELQTQSDSAEGALHSLIRTHQQTIVGQVTTGHALAASSAAIDNSFLSVERQFDILDNAHPTSLSPLVDTAVLRQSCRHEAAVANVTTSSLTLIKQQYDGLVNLEDAMWAGHGADEAFLVQLEQIPSQNAGIDTAVVTAIRNRYDLLRTMASEQLSNAWRAAISVSEGTSEGGPRIQVANQVELSTPRPRRQTVSKPTVFRNCSRP
ncbi:uncharacterized protein LOC62_04G006324 [Vanrija pseudolonga]|uniref:Uncharacterized protein n=1 Tax=Vanrija pseudolonga TaxID=143232 RepID=A0AAF1BIZ4_9TREE|nr:hypothetical protein LOC62_04G006324 [Vanrija pseudolonga]